MVSGVVEGSASAEGRGIRTATGYGLVTIGRKGQIMKTIVVGVDGTETAQAACREAATIAAALGSRLHLVNAVGPDAPVTVGVGSDTFTVSTKDDGELLLDQTVKSLPRDLEVTTNAVAGKPPAVIIAEAERLDAGLIVVGSTHMQGIKRVLGSVANEVSHHAPCSVYIAKTT